MEVEIGMIEIYNPNLCGDVDKSLIDKKAHILVEQVCDILQDLSISTLSCLLQKEGSQSSHRFSTTQKIVSN